MLKCETEYLYTRYVYYSLGPKICKIPVHLWGKNVFYIDRLAIEAANICNLFNKVLMYTFNSPIVLEPMKIYNKLKKQIDEKRLNE